MNLWTDDNASVMEAFMNNTTTTNSDLWPPPPPPPHQLFHQQLSSGSNSAQPFNQERFQQRLRSLIDGARESWTYAIYWQSSYDYSTSSTVLGWGDGYYKGDLTKPKSVVASSSALEQEHRRKVLRELYSLICPADEAAVDEEVTDTEWFFLLSMTQSFHNGAGLAGQAFFSGAPAWVSGPDRLYGSDCKRARQGNLLGFHTMVWVPSGSGVVELGSTDAVPLNPDLIRKVRIWFYFDRSDPGGPSSLWINPTAVPSITACSVANANFSAAEESSRRKRSPSTSVTDSRSSGMSTSVGSRSLASDDSEGLTPSAVFSQIMNPKGR